MGVDKEERKGEEEPGGGLWLDRAEADFPTVDAFHLTQHIALVHHCIYYTLSAIANMSNLSDDTLRKVS